ncbi:RsfA family transcriptional regulator [Bacillus horti]|uniref:Prespore-specific regulator n=1 Tax=Caldalkalibacillus horti TaxID=77523 RepID=A0ABT9VUC5_9BACI|nr:RsfA family transcriptional regulator [Bacillus horti]MDQ0164588.1 prespore-specific regulator [Bacillus horti]
MTATRQDAWTEDDDLLLAEVVLRHIREGSTQLNAFEEVGYRLARTSAACGFRWNSLVRKKYESAIQIAKAQRQQRKSRGKNRYITDHSMPAEREHLPRYTQPTHEDTVHPLLSNFGYEFDNAKEMMKEKAISEKSFSDSTVSEQNGEVSLDQVIRFLKQQKDSFKRLGALEKDVQFKDEEIKRLRDENHKMRKELGTVQTDYQTMNDDYKALIKIMDRARKLAFLGEETEDKVSFKMDKNGNLERVEKS